MFPKKGFMKSSKETYIIPEPVKAIQLNFWLNKKLLCSPQERFQDSIWNKWLTLWTRSQKYQQSEIIVFIVFVSVFLGITIWPLTTAHLSAVSPALSLSPVPQSPHLRRVSIASCVCAVMSVLVRLAFCCKPFQSGQEHIIVPSYEINQMKRVTALSRHLPGKLGHSSCWWHEEFAAVQSFCLWSSLAKAIGHHSGSLNLQTLILCASFSFSALGFETSSHIVQ